MEQKRIKKMLDVFVQGCAVDGVAAEQSHEEFWRHVYGAYDLWRARVDEHGGHGEGQPNQVIKFLSDNGWAEISAVDPAVRQSNVIFRQLTKFVKDALESAKSSESEEEEQAEFSMCMWLMDPAVKHFLYHQAPRPEQHIRIFVLLPPPGKDWILQERGFGKMHDKVLFLALHFPTIFPADRPGEDEAARERSKTVRRHFMEEVRLVAEQLRGLLFAFPPSSASMDDVSAEIYSYLESRWQRTNKLYFSLLRRHPDFLSHYASEYSWRLKYPTNILRLFNH